MRVTHCRICGRKIIYLKGHPNEIREKTLFCGINGVGWAYFDLCEYCQEALADARWQEHATPKGGQNNEK